MGEHFVSRHFIRKTALLTITLFVLAAVFCSIGLAATIIVCPSGCDYSSIQEAINSASNQDVIEIYSGQYNEAVVVNRSLTIIGVDTGTGYPVIDAGGADDGWQIESPGVTLSRLNITGAGHTAVRLQADDAVLNSLTVIHDVVADESMAWPAVTGENVTGVAISSCIFLVQQDAVVLFDPDNYSITGNTFEYPMGYSVAIVCSDAADSATDGIIAENSITEKGGEAIAVRAREAAGSVKNLTIEGNSIAGGARSIEILIPSDNVVIRENTLLRTPLYTDVGNYGIWLSRTSGVVVDRNDARNLNVDAAYEFESCSDLWVTDNIADSTTGTGMYLTGIHGSTFTGNIMTGNAYNFWFDQDALDPGIMPGNRIDTSNKVDGKPVRYFEGVDGLTVDGTEPVGTLILYACNDTNVHDLSCASNGAGVSAVRCENLTVADCSFLHMKYGIYTLYAPHLRVTGNRLAGCIEGITVDSLSDGKVAGNRIEYSGDCGIVAMGILSEVSIRENVVDGAAFGIGLRRVSISRDVIVGGNTVGRTSIAAISSDGSSGAEISGNSLEPAGGIGFDIDDSSALNITGNTLVGVTETAVRLDNSPYILITTNTLTSSGTGFAFERHISDSGSMGNRIINNMINCSEPVTFTIIGGVGNTGAPAFGKKPITPISEIQSGACESGDDSGAPTAGPALPDPDPPANVWNMAKTAGTNIVGGPYLGGNYWASPNGTGFSQTHPDRGDGFCDGSFSINQNNVDELPLHMGTRVEAVQDLITKVDDFRLQAGIENSLIAKLTTAQSQIERMKYTPAIQVLEAFIHQVEAQRGKAISTAQADDLIVTAQRIVSSLSLEG
jgi:parallel beta-helix repeat protein